MLCIETLLKMYLKSFPINITGGLHFFTILPVFLLFYANEMLQSNDVFFRVRL